MVETAIKFSDRIDEIHRKYLDIISPFVMQLEILDGEFPIEIFNEIRAVFAHLSKYYTSCEDDDIKDRNISKAEGHIKRAILDCYKYLCLSYHDCYVAFRKQYEFVNLCEVDNGEFVPRLCSCYNSAVDALKEAKRLELSSTTAEDELYSAFEDAYNAYAIVYDMTTSSFEKFERLSTIAGEEKKRDNRRNCVSIAIGVIGIVVGVVGWVAPMFFSH